MDQDRSLSSVRAAASPQESQAPTTGDASDPPSEDSSAASYAPVRNIRMEGKISVNDFWNSFLEHPQSR